MKHSESLLPLAGVFAITALLAACSSTPVAGTGAAEARPAAPAAVPAAPAADAAAAPASRVATVTLPPHQDPKNPIHTERSVYFDYDDFTVKDRYHEMLGRHGRYLQSQPRLAIRLEGHADERGSPEYNLSLGQKRAEAVLRALKIVGAGDAQMEAVSYGEERPRSAARDESAWAENRRVDMAYRP